MAPAVGRYLSGGQRSLLSSELAFHEQITTKIRNHVDVDRPPRSCTTACYYPHRQPETIRLLTGNASEAPFNWRVGGQALLTGCF
ncbi:hypothetical protein [Mesorhizobium sp.]|uniref:hypothetical protein n=1 Tax=Mesorhizobium sp. TaxID=1871066 RepID=UPI0025C565D1|nr:hypothetical protein [Mesorhizobium sp.]